MLVSVSQRRTAGSCAEEARDTQGHPCQEARERPRARVSSLGRRASAKAALRGIDVLRPLKEADSLGWRTTSGTESEYVSCRVHIAFVRDTTA